MVSDEFRRKCEAMYLPTNNKLNIPFHNTNSSIVIMCDNGIVSFVYKIDKSSGQEVCFFSRVFTWDEFVVQSYYVIESTRHSTAYYNFLLNGVQYTSYTEDDMKAVIINKTNDSPRLKSVINTLMREYLKQNQVKCLDSIDKLGYLPDIGWVLPDKFHFISNNEKREEMGQLIKKRYSGPLDLDQAKQNMRSIYQLTTIEYKDIIFAYFIIAPFLYAMRKFTRIMPFLALGGEGDLGKTNIVEFGSKKMFGHLAGNVGGRNLDSLARIDAIFTASTFLLGIDDCSDLKPHAVGLFKRYSTSEEDVYKFNPDQSLKYHGDFCSPLAFTFNLLPILYDDPQLRQRIITLFPRYMINNPQWLEVYNSIPDGQIGYYIYQMSKDLTFQDLKSLYDHIEYPNTCSGRAKVIYKLLALGKLFAKRWFDIDLNFEFKHNERPEYNWKLDDLLKDALKIGNEEIISLVYQQIKEGTHFLSTEFENENGDKVAKVENPRHRSWVTAEVSKYNYKGTSGYLLNSDNVLDLANRLKRNPSQFSTRTLLNVLKTEWNDVSIGSFWFKGQTVYGLFIPAQDIDHVDIEVTEAEVQSMVDNHIEQNPENEI